MTYHLRTLAISFNESTVWAEVVMPGVERQRLLTSGRVARTKILLDRVKLGAGVKIDLGVSAADIVWFQMLEGEAQLTYGPARIGLGATHIVFLPADFAGTLTTKTGAVFLYAQLPNAERFDPDFSQRPPQFRVIDWTREPVLDSERDARKRICVATPQLFGTTAIRSEMIICPPGTEAANHHHEGAEHFMYVLQGRGTAYANEKPIAVRKGDLVYYDDCERHYLRAEGAEETVFVEFFVPGMYTTVYATGCLTEESI